MTLTTALSWLLLASSILLGAFGQVFLKLAVDQAIGTGVHFYFDLLRRFWLYAGALSYGISFLTWLSALRSFDVGFARPFTSIGYIVTYLIAIAVLGEEFSVRRLVGIAVIIFGVSLLK